MRKIITISLIITNIAVSVYAQDYFSDLNSGATPVLFKGTENVLFSATLNVGDNSVKANFFKQYWLKRSDFKPLDLPRHKNFLGWGLNAKAKTEDGLGALFSTGQFNPGFNAGGYLSFSNLYWYKNNAGTETFGQWAFILSGTLSTSKFQFYNSMNSFTTQLSDTTFNGKTVSFSFVNGFLGGHDNLYLGASVTLSKLNNYSNLDKVEVKNDSVYTNGAGSDRIVTGVNDDGYTYAVGAYKQYNNFNVRFNLSYIPAALNYFLAFIIYPSVDYSNAYKPKYNTGFSIAHLVKGSPSTSDAALFFELNDITNVASKDDVFFKRSLKFGISTSLNVFTSSK